MARAFQTSCMAHTYMKFDFGTDEETAQQARHKLETWKQAFRLDKKLQYKLDRGEEPNAEGPAGEDSHEEETSAPHTKGEAGHKSHAKTKHEARRNHRAAKGKHLEDEDAAANGSKVTLLVRLYFSSHEKLSEQRWFDRIPSEEPFKSASPQIIREGEAEFAESEKHFSDLG